MRYFSLIIALSFLLISGNVQDLSLDSNQNIGAQDLNRGFNSTFTGGTDAYGRIFARRIK